jgi:hypothetical protein
MVIEDYGRGYYLTKNQITADCWYIEAFIIMR